MEQAPNLSGHPSEGLVRRKENVSAAINLIPTQCSPGMKTPESYDHRIVPSIISGRPFWYFPANGLQLAQRAALANDASFQAEIFRRVKLPGFVLRVEFEGLGTCSNAGGDPSRSLHRVKCWLLAPGLNWTSLWVSMRRSKQISQRILLRCFWLFAGLPQLCWTSFAVVTPQLWMLYSSLSDHLGSGLFLLWH